jgi:FtsP/CotA-like multicopper oxidase with cupredoxin domain
VSEHSRGLTRRSLLFGGAGAATAIALGGRLGASPQRQASDLKLAAANPLDRTLHLAATDGWVSMPPSAPAIPTFWPDPYAAAHDAYPYSPGQGLNLYCFGFRNVTGMTAAEISAQRGKAQISAPQLVFDEGTEVRITLSNLGLSQRPDLVDGHTIHWHGFVDAIPMFDGVPELSLSVPIGRDFTYLYRPHDAGTYMYHCHFEDVEHVQMGMTGVVFVRPAQNGTQLGSYDWSKSRTQYAYNDGDGTTQYDREFGFMLTEIWAEAHYRDAHIQTTDWTDYKPSFWCMNGRSYPDTVAPSSPKRLLPSIAPDPSDPFANAIWYDPTQTDLNSAATARLAYQPMSSLITCNEGERVLLRMSSLGYQNHAMTVDDIELTVVAKDASLLRNGGSNQYLVTNTVDVAPGESRDVIFTAPEHSGGSGSDTYLLYDRDLAYASNAGGPGFGGMATEIRVYPAGTLPPQLVPNA